MLNYSSKHEILNDMKTLKYIIAVFAAAVLASCSLDEQSFTNMEQKNYMKNAVEAENVLLGVYENLTNEHMYGYHLSLYFPLGTDQAKVSGVSLDGFRDIPSNMYSTSAVQVQQTWAALYNGIYDANDFIERLSGLVGTYSEADKNRAAVMMAEARALRALYYFELVRWYGNVVLMKSTADSKKHPSTFVQATPAEVYEYIEQDLLYAIKTLPYADEDTYRSSNAYRFSKAAAIGLLTKVYATWAGYPVCDQSKWQKAVATAKPLIESGKHGLQEDYEQLWKNTSNGIWDPLESLLEVSFYAPVISGGDAVGRIGKWNGVQSEQISTDYIRISAYWTVVPPFISKWIEKEPKDKRLALSYADYTYDANKKKTTIGKGFASAIAAGQASNERKTFNGKLYVAKWDLIKYADNYLSDANYTNTNWYLLRYSDVLLLYAEALNELNKAPNDDAYAAINMVRRRAGLSNLTAGLSYEAFKQAVRDERSHELCFEGHRKQDLVRWGNYYEAIQQTVSDLNDWHEEANTYYLIGEYTVKGKHELLPIPQRDLDMMTACDQNPNW